MEKENKKTHFILVHGACHGAWCWYKLATLLTSAGHQVTAVDLAASGINSKQLNELRSFHDYSQPLMDAMASIPPQERVVLVGHSFGGMNLALAMEYFPKKISAAVFLTAVMPGITLQPSRLRDEFFTRSPLEYFMDSKYTFDHGPEKPPTSVTFGPEYMLMRMYQLCPPEDFTLATMLVRPVNWFLDDISKDTMISKENYESVSRVYVVCKEDQSMKEDFQRWMIEQSSVKEVKEIEDADHMAMLSKPKELCNCLLEIAQKYD